MMLGSRRRTQGEVFLFAGAMTPGEEHQLRQPHRDQCVVMNAVSTGVTSQHRLGSPSKQTYPFGGFRSKLHTLAHTVYYYFWFRMCSGSTRCMAQSTRSELVLTHGFVRIVFLLVVANLHSLVGEIVGFSCI